jgi:hypothetical protein
MLPSLRAHQLMSWEGAEQKIFVRSIKKTHVFNLDLV